MKSNYEATNETPPLREKTVAEILVEYIEEGQRRAAQREYVERLLGRHPVEESKPWRQWAVAVNNTAAFKLDDKTIDKTNESFYLGRRPIEVIDEVNH